MRLHCPSLLVLEKLVDTQQLFKFDFQSVGNNFSRVYVNWLNISRRRSSVSGESIYILVT